VRSSSALLFEEEECAVSAARRVSSVPTHLSRISRIERSTAGYEGGIAEFGEGPEWRAVCVIVTDSVVCSAVKARDDRIARTCRGQVRFVRGIV
jgi:hypothetical protein